MNKESAESYFLFSRLFCKPPADEGLAVEYARLFAVPGRSMVVPCESAYCDRLEVDFSNGCGPYFEAPSGKSGFSGFLYGPSAVEVSKIYLQAGFQLEKEGGVLPDHLSIELEFMGWLQEQKDEEKGSQFFKKHLGRWVFRCLEEIDQKTECAFYKELASHCALFLSNEEKRMP